MAEIESFAPGLEFLLAGGPLMRTAPVFLEVKKNQENNQADDESRQSQQNFAEHGIDLRRQSLPRKEANATEARDQQRPR